MAGERRLRILALLAGAGPDRETKRLCEVCAEVTGASGAGIMLMAGDVSRGSICTTDPVRALIEQLQYDLGEGPCIDAYRLDAAVMEPDLAEPVVPRWLAFSPPALEAGARSVFGFPLRVGAVRLGAMNLYSTRRGPLTADQHADALVMADVACKAVLVLQADAAQVRSPASSPRVLTSDIRCTRLPAWSLLNSTSPSTRRWCGSVLSPSATTAA